MPLTLRQILDIVGRFDDAPIALDAVTRARLDAFRGQDLTQPGSWFVLGAHEVSAHDFAVLTGRGGAA